MHRRWRSAAGVRVTDQDAIINLTSTGSVGVSSGGTWASSGSFAVYSGTVNIDGAGSVTDQNGYDGLENGVAAWAISVVVSSGTWSNSSGLYVGAGATGLLTVTGGNVTSQDIYIGDADPYGYGYPGNGTAAISGGTMSAANAFVVGESGTGELDLTSSGVVTVASGTGTLTLGDTAGSAGTLNLGSGTAAPGTLNVAVVTGGAGTATVNFNQPGSYTFAPQLAGSLSVNQNGTGATILNGNETYTGATAINSGTPVANGSIASSSGA